MGDRLDIVRSCLKFARDGLLRLLRKWPTKSAVTKPQGDEERAPATTTLGNEEIAEKQEIGASQSNTLDRWHYLLEPTPREIICPSMSLHSFHDAEPAIFAGSGMISLRSLRTTEFTMDATPENPGDAFRRLIEMQRNPYDAHRRFRLVARDVRGVEWACGWTNPIIKGNVTSTWPLYGKLQGLMTDGSGTGATRESSVEAIFLAPMSETVGSTFLSVGELHRSSDPTQTTWNHALEVMGSLIQFRYRPSDGLLFVTATTSEQIPHSYLEGWIAEPLRILFGQLVFPRLLARNFGSERAFVTLSPSPRFFHHAGIASLFGARLTGDNREAFWSLYVLLFRYIASSRDARGNPNWHANKLTNFYEEIAQASQGSRWVLFFSLASVAEGIANELMSLTPDESIAERNEELERLLEHIGNWQGDEALRSRAIQNIERFRERTIGRFFRQMESRGVLNRTQIASWQRMRNSVMHGRLVSPWSTEEEDTHLMELANMVHRLTLELISQVVDSTVATSVVDGEIGNTPDTSHYER